MITPADFFVDESSITGESDLMKKTPEDHPHEGATPFLISGSKINDGTGFGMVMAVGPNSQLGIMRASMDTKPPLTPLQIKLTDLSEMIGWVGMAGATLTVVGCTIGMFINIFADKDVYSSHLERPFLEGDS
jgi:Ca2+-transporting ATPase